MKILGLDISTKTGVAVIEDGQLTHYELIHVEFMPVESKIDDFNCLDRASIMAKKLLAVVTSVQPDFIFIEQTNLGNNRRDQKLLEFTHAMVLYELYGVEKKVVYVDSAQWRSTLGQKMTKEDRKHNKTVKERKSEGIRSKKGEGKLTPKHLSVRWCNEKYGLSLLIKDNDIADAICLASYGYLNRQSPQVNVNLDTIDNLF